MSFLVFEFLLLLKMRIWESGVGMGDLKSLFFEIGETFFFFGFGVDLIDGVPLVDDSLPVERSRYILLVFRGGVFQSSAEDGRFPGVNSLFCYHSPFYILGFDDGFGFVT